MKKIPAFKAGTHTDMNGKTLTFNREDLIATANAYNPASHEAPIVIGHPVTDDPAYGWIDRFEVDGDELIAIPVQVEPVFGEMVDKGRFKKISMSFYEPNNPANPKKGVWYPKHVGFLGATPPAIKGLKPIAFSEGNGNATFTAEFADGTGDSNDLMGGLAKGLQAFLLYFASLNPFPKEAETTPALPFNPYFSETNPTEHPNPTENKETTMTDQTAPVTPPVNPVPVAPPVSQTPTTVTVADPATVAENEALKKRIADMEQAEQKAKNDSKLAEHVAYAENLVTAGKLPPAQKDVTVAILSQIDSGSQTVSFGEGDTAKPLAGEFKAFLDTLPVNPMFSEAATKGQAPNAPNVAFNTNADPDRVLADKQIKDYANAHNVSYAEAAHAVMMG